MIVTARDPLHPSAAGAILPVEATMTTVVPRPAAATPHPAKTTAVAPLPHATMTILAATALHPRAVHLAALPSMNPTHPHAAAIESPTHTAVHLLDEAGMTTDTVELMDMTAHLGGHHRLPGVMADTTSACRRDIGDSILSYPPSLSPAGAGSASLKGAIGLFVQTAFKPPDSTFGGVSIGVEES